MSPRISEEQVNAVVDQLKQGLKPREIAQNVNCHLATVYRIDRNLRLFDSPKPPPAIRGRPRKITADILQDIEEYCAHRDRPGLAEIAYYISQKYGMSISQSSMSRAMKESGMPRETWSKPPKSATPVNNNSYRVQKTPQRPSHAHFLAGHNNHRENLEGAPRSG
ncbi:hypothetical protein VTO42DRAFT_6546 [Malbranchea cinnamomea]